MIFTFLLTTLWWQLQPVRGVDDVHQHHHQQPLPGASDDVHHPNVGVVGEQSADFREPKEVVANDSEITLGLTLLNIKRVKSIADIFQVLP